MRGVATNVYSRKTSEKPERCGLRTLSMKGSGVVFTYGEGLVAMFTPVYGGTTVKGGSRTKKMRNYCPVLCQARQGELRRLLIPY